MLSVASNHIDNSLNLCHPWTSIKVLWELGSLPPDVLLQVKYLNALPWIPRIVITSNDHDPMTIVDQSTPMTGPGRFLVCVELCYLAPNSMSGICVNFHDLISRRTDDAYLQNVNIENCYLNSLPVYRFYTTEASSYKKMG